MMYGLDLFSGIGGITKALEGYVQPIAYCENDRYAQAVLLSRMASGDIPNAPLWDDVRTLGSRLLPKVQIVYGGFPCQDISVAGRGEGLEGKRSGLFFQIARLVSELRPRFVFLENVSAIRIRGGDVVAGTLAGLGYDCRWAPLSASDVGANHERERWWLLAHAVPPGERWDERESKAKADALENSRRKLFKRSIEQRANGMEARKQNADQLKRSGEVAYTGLLGSSKCKKQPAGTNQYGEEIPDTTSIRLEEGWQTSWTQSDRSNRSSWWSTEPNVGRVAHGIPFRVDRLKGLGNAVVPAQAREAFERPMGLK